MARIAFICPPFRGHLDPMLALARALAVRGHHPTFLQMEDARSLVEGDGIGFVPLGSASHPKGALASVTRRMAGIDGLLGLGAILEDMRASTSMFVRDGPAACRASNVEMIVGDQTEAGAGLVARHLGLPFVSVANALPLNRDDALPPPFVGWRYRSDRWGRERNRGGYRVSDWLMRAHHRAIADVARDWGLGELRTIEDCASPTLQISQMVAGLDFPRETPPSGFRYVGPVREQAARATSFARLRSERPLIFASLGTLQGSRAALFSTIAAAAARLDAELVIAHGGGLTEDDIASLPGQPRVYDFVPQREVLAKASLAVLHGGMNTVLDALAADVPIVAVPIAFEQAAIAERIVHAGAGLRVSTPFRSAGRLHRAMLTVLTDPSYAAAAHRLADEIGRAGGVEEAADLVEQVLRSGSVCPNHERAPAGVASA